LPATQNESGGTTIKEYTSSTGDKGASKYF
jgi:hypothetical protein